MITECQTLQDSQILSWEKLW